MTLKGKDFSLAHPVAQSTKVTQLSTIGTFGNYFHKVRQVCSCSLSFPGFNFRALRPGWPCKANGQYFTWGALDGERVQTIRNGNSCLQKMGTTGAKKGR